MSHFLRFLRWLSNLEIILMFYDPYQEEHGPYLLIQNLHPAIPRIEMKAIVTPLDNVTNPERSHDPVNKLVLEFKCEPLHLTLEISEEAITLNCR